MTSEILVEGELEIERSRIPDDVIADVAAECQGLLDGVPASLYYFVDVASTPDSLGLIMQAYYRLKVLRSSGLVAMQCVLDLHPHPESPEANVFINTQQPGAEQNLHPDVVQGKQAIVQASDSGLFDYCPDPSDESYIESIEVNSGDVLWLNCPSIRHRGRNPSQEVRHTLVLSSNLPIE